LVSLACIGYIAAYPNSVGFAYASAPLPFTALWTCVSTASAGLLAALFGAGQLLARGALTARAARGRLAGWAVVPADEIDDVDALPRLFPFGSANQVLIRRDAPTAGPFRTGESSSPVLRI